MMYWRATSEGFDGQRKNLKSKSPNLGSFSATDGLATPTSLVGFFCPNVSAGPQTTFGRFILPSNGMAGPSFFWEPCPS